ncbi:MAG TPA: cytochrome c [Acidobacteriota bacterium]|nr:cytochrome c [Acidobacteriota bacterium]
MNWTIVIPILILMLILQWRRVGMLTWVFVWWGSLYVILSYGFATPIPQSVIELYMGIVTLGLIVYVTANKERWQAVWGPLRAFMTERRYLPILLLVIVAVPSLVAANVYWNMTAPVQAPFFARTIHPASPASITAFDGKEFNLVTLDNPFRNLEDSDPAAFQRHVENGRRVYYENCHYCHGDNMAGNGQFAHGLNPIPTNFADPGNIPNLQESFLFWRIAKGAPGLPEEGGPWESAMPVWEKFLTEEEIWDVVIFLYEFTGFRPRAREEGHE